MSDPEGIHAFINARIKPAKESLSPRFALAFQQLREDSIQKYRLRYVLAKLTQYVDEQAWGSVAPHNDLETFINNKVDIEHVLPQTPSNEIIEEFDKTGVIEEYIRYFGNLTLVEKTIDCSIGN